MIIRYEIDSSYIAIDIGKNIIYFRVEFLFNINFSYLIDNIYKHKYENNISDDILKIIPEGDTTFNVINKIKISNPDNDKLFNMVSEYIEENQNFINDIVLKPNLIDRSNTYKNFLSFINFYKNNNYIKPYFEKLNKIYMAFLIHNNIC